MGIPWMQMLKQTHFATKAAVIAGNLTVCSVFSSRRSYQRDFNKMLSQCCTNKTPTIPTITGNAQSPINIVSSEAIKSEQLSTNPIQFTEAASVFELQNTGSSLNAEPGQDNEYQISGGPLANPYNLVGFHFHWVKNNEDWSEHTVDDVAYSGELHLVHLNKPKYKSVEEALSYQDGLCVLGVFLKSGHADHKELGMLTQYFNKLKYKCDTIPMKEAFRPYSLLPADRKSYWTYPGSLTTPPYSECVTWVVFKDPILVSASQMLEFRNLKPITSDEAKHMDKNNTPIPETTTNARDTYPVADRIINSTFDK